MTAKNTHSCDYCENEITSNIEDTPITLSFEKHSSFRYCSVECAFKMLSQELLASDMSINDITDLINTASNDLDKDLGN